MTTDPLQDVNKIGVRINVMEFTGGDQANPELAVYWMKKSSSEGFSPTIDYLTANGIKLNDTTEKIE